MKTLPKPVNVASVKQRSPFRYPGGKTWFVPYAIRWLKQFNNDITYIEPFAGGGIVGLTCAFEDLASQVILVEKDDDIAAVWQTILGKDGKWLARQILDFELIRKNVETVLSSPIASLRQRAFVTFLRNRLHHGGILANGAGLLKNGENGKGLASRWYPGTLSQRIEDIVSIKDRISFIHGDGFEIIEGYRHDENAVFFLDPPYVQAARRLYRYFDIDHKQLFSLVSRVKGDFLMTYDDSEDIVRLAEQHHFEVERVVMKTTLHYQKYELVIGRDLSWLREQLSE
ncbi:MAG: DNA adenine methylase [Planctomycetes bacterium]|nr:DNA adenine methylase [Planctomycetota bacterium]